MTTASQLNGGKPPRHRITLAFLIGPEGGLTDAEVDQAKGAGFHAARLGPRVLRTETAPLVALAVAQQLEGDF